MIAESKAETASHIRLIAVDLDKTLLDESHQVPEENRAALAAAAARGVTVAIATGRTHESAARYARQLGIAAPIISYNGAMVRGIDDAEPMHHVPLPAELAAEIVRVLVHEMIEFVYFLDNRLYVARCDRWAREYLARTGDQPCPVGDMRRFAGATPTKILLVGTPEQTRERHGRFSREYAGRIYPTISLPQYMEILHPDATKAKGLRWLAGHLGVPMEQTMAIGDGLNDLEMVKEAGIGVFMPSAEEDLRAQADYVPTDPRAGVAEAVRRFVLDEGGGG